MASEIQAQWYDPAKGRRAWELAERTAKESIPDYHVTPGDGVKWSCIVIDAIHPDEEPAGEESDALHQLLQKQPIVIEDARVESVIGNELAFNAGRDAQGKRLRKIRHNVAHYKGGWAPIGPEEQRTAEIINSFGKRYSLMLSRHGTRVPNADFAFARPIDSYPIAVAAFMGLKRLVHYGESHYSAWTRNHLGIDLSPGSPLTSWEIREVLIMLAKGFQPERKRISTYRFAGDISVKQAARLEFPDEIEPFTPLPRRCITALNKLGWRHDWEPLPANTVAISGGTVYRDTGAWGEIAVPMER